MTITEFLLARIAEDEAAVEVFDGKRWTFDGGEVRDDVTDNPYVPWGRTVLDVGYEGMCQNGLEAHVARHDPARVLAECAAKRAIVKQHEDWPVLVEGKPNFSETADDIQGVAYRVSQEMAWLTEREYVQRFGVEPPTSNMVRALAAVYADHEDYRQEWAC